MTFIFAYFSEMGSAIMQYMNCSRSVRIRGEGFLVGKTKSIKDVLEGDEKMSAGSVAAISFQLTKYLCVLHDSSICIEKLSETNTFIRQRKKNVSIMIIIYYYMDFHILRLYPCLMWNYTRQWRLVFCK